MSDLDFSRFVNYAASKRSDPIQGIGENRGTGRDQNCRVPIPTGAGGQSPKLEIDPFNYFDSVLIEHTKNNKRILGTSAKQYGTCMVAAVNLYAKKRIYKNSEDLYEQNKHLLHIPIYTDIYNIYR